MMDTKTDKKWFTADDVELAKSALDDLPDLTEKRLTKSSVLEQLMPQIILLSESKGYSAEDIKAALESVGITVGIKAVRDILNSKNKTGKKVRQTRTVTTTAEKPEANGQQTN
ncbi:molybdopterin-guanine dinucleotide biosynthesis protein MobC [Dryocola sp. BD626]|uniref:molybdopterin-guanine dinucleotide biosynthesis protein MobC n=1 Tax=Dryocola sp. BD626 TaxID=3133273 RepID=UPI003F505038